MPHLIMRIKTIDGILEIKRVATWIKWQESCVFLQAINIYFFKFDVFIDKHNI